jgi:hypothetical protein
MIGADAKQQLWARRLLPWRRYERIVAKVAKIDV